MEKYRRLVTLDGISSDIQSIPHESLEFVSHTIKPTYAQITHELAELPDMEMRIKRYRLKRVVEAVIYEYEEY